ncbi:MAG: prolyl oligopeptidase family serine peptidase [Desulfotignum sp.]|nr:prolyl oligopeptidase family serine peptidase [Desulfotignum sp.]
MRIPVIVVIAVLVFLLTRYVISRKLLYFPVKANPEYLAQITARIPEAEAIQIPVGKKTILHGWLVKKDLTRLPTVFYFGGNAEEVSGNLADFSARLNANAVLINYRGYGQSIGSPTEDRLKSDALAIYDHMADQLALDPARCVAWGRSLGSSMAAWLALERDFGKLILTCPFDSIQAVAGAYYPAWLVNLVLEDRHRIIDFAHQIVSPTLVLVAPEDEVIPYAHTHRLYERLTCPKQLVPVHGAGHNTISSFETYYNAVNTFLEKDLKGPGSGLLPKTPVK